MHSKWTPVHAWCFCSLMSECNFTGQVLAVLCGLLECLIYLTSYSCKLFGHAHVKYEDIKIVFLEYSFCV